MGLGLAERAGVHVVVGRVHAGRNPQGYVRAFLGQVLGASEHVGHGRAHHVRRVVVVAGQRAADAVEQALRRVARRGVHARGVDREDGVVAVLVDRVLKLVGDGVDGLVPADALELALASLAHALHGVHQAVRAVEPAPHGAAAQACARLEVGVADVVGLHVQRLAVLGVPLEYAVASAVDVALAPVDGLLAIRMGERDRAPEELVGLRLLRRRPRQALPRPLPPSRTYAESCMLHPST